MLKGYAGRIAWIDLTDETVKVEKLEEALARSIWEVKAWAPTSFINISRPIRIPMIPII